MLISDAIICLSLEREKVSLFCGFIFHRNKWTGLAISSNKSFLGRGKGFNEHVLATAILDRLLYHTMTLNIKAKSYQLKEKRWTERLGQVNYDRS